MTNIHNAQTTNTPNGSSPLGGLEGLGGQESLYNLKCFLFCFLQIIVHNDVVELVGEAQFKLRAGYAVVDNLRRVSCAAFETAGQFAYIYALADEAHVALSAPIISAYCAASVLWSRIFLKEKLSWKHYAMIALVVIGIVMIGVFDI